jgi:alpha-L-glutamate ligase-like protein
MAISKNIMGMNARNYLYIREFNRPSKIRIADDKLLTKERLLKYHLPTPALLHSFYTRDDIKNFSWDLPQKGFVIKPSRGYGGAGILPIVSWNGHEAITIVGERYDKKQLAEHLYDLLEGSYSLQFLPDTAFIENLIIPDPFFRRIAPIGLPDIRVIVFNYIPIMAMMRIPTKQSKGKANLHQAAVACGIDIRSGHTTFGVLGNKQITSIPDINLSVKDIQIPHWDEILLLASKAQHVLGLGYAGVDIILDKKLGPAVLEVNARPGLNIQIANQSSLRNRLERVEDMEVESAERGVEIGQSLFGSLSLGKKTEKERVVTVSQQIKIITPDLTKKIEAKLDTGALRSSLDIDLAKKLNLKKVNKIVYVKSASGKTIRNMVEVTFMLGGKKIKTEVSVIDRAELEFPMIIGRRDLQGFLIKPILKENTPDTDNNERKIIAKQS